MVRSTKDGLALIQCDPCRALILLDAPAVAQSVGEKTGIYSALVIARVYSESRGLEMLVPLTQEQIREAVADQTRYLINQD